MRIRQPSSRRKSHLFVHSSAEPLVPTQCQAKERQQAIGETRSEYGEGRSEKNDDEVRKRAAGVADRHCESGQRVVRKIQEMDSWITGKEVEEGGKREGQEMTFHVILMELGPVGVARTASGGPDGGASSVRKKIAFDASLQPTSFNAYTSAR